MLLLYILASRPTCSPQGSHLYPSTPLDSTFSHLGRCSFANSNPFLDKREEEEAETMKVETGILDGKKRNKKGVSHGANAGRIMKKKICRMPRHRVQAPIPIQRLFNTCKPVFKGPGTVPSPVDVQNLQVLLDKMRAEDLGLTQELPFFSATSDVDKPRISCTPIYNCDNFMMCIFFLPATAVIPLHNHPGMTVFSKLLLGSMHIKAYDWVDPTVPDETTSSSSSHCKQVRRLARLKVDAEFSSPCNTSVLYPTAGGNIHTFTAITPCAILDVLGPPYSAKDGRDCTYYRDYAFSSSSASGNLDSLSDIETSDAVETTTHQYGWLEEIEITPEEEIHVVDYMGPPIIDN